MANKENMNSKEVFAVISIRKLVSIQASPYSTQRLNTGICIVCVSVVLACSDSPPENETIDVHDDKQPSLENMVYIPAGEFIMGKAMFDEHTQHIVYLDDFYIDKD